MLFVDYIETEVLVPQGPLFILTKILNNYLFLPEDVTKYKYLFSALEQESKNPVHVLPRHDLYFSYITCQF